MTAHGQGAHGGRGCWTAVAVRFAKPDRTPEPAALVAIAVNGVLADCKRLGADPDGLINVSVGAGRLLVELFETVRQGPAANPRSTANSDQVTATFKAEPELFAALAFAHVVRRDPA